MKKALFIFMLLLQCTCHAGAVVSFENGLTQNKVTKEMDMKLNLVVNNKSYIVDTYIKVNSPVTVNKGFVTFGPYFHIELPQNCLVSFFDDRNHNVTIAGTPQLRGNVVIIPDLRCLIDK